MVDTVYVSIAGFDGGGGQAYWNIFFVLLFIGVGVWIRVVRK